MFIKQTGDNSTTVGFNGTACVVIVAPGDKKSTDSSKTPIGGKEGETGPKTMIPVIEMS